MCIEGWWTGARMSGTFWFARGAFVLFGVRRRTNIAFIGRVELLARALVCFSLISLLLDLVLRFGVWTDKT